MEQICFFIALLSVTVKSQHKKEKQKITSYEVSPTLCQHYHISTAGSDSQQMGCFPFHSLHPSIAFLSKHLTSSSLFINYLLNLQNHPQSNLFLVLKHIGKGTFVHLKRV
uniref:Uncharacterized protein n=1 Tax=Anguilla anguilla TaxID=7936 RepID=A0A0E9WZ35_ANGAN